MRSVVWTLWRLGMKRRPHAPSIYSDLKSVYGDLVDDGLKEHKGLTQTLTADPARQLDPLDGYVLSYCKLWLRSRDSALAVDHFEAEINLLVGLLLPLWGAAAIFFPAQGASWGLGALGVALIANLAIVSLVRDRQRDELFQAVKHFRFAQWFSERTQPVAATGRKPQSEPTGEE